MKKSICQFLVTITLFCWTTVAALGGDDEAQVPLFDGLGQHSRLVAFNSKEAQQYFDQGLCFLFAFNHDEAIRSFKRAAKADPACAMAWWGIAIANGPHINNPVVPPARAKEAWSALKRARHYAGDDAGPSDAALIEALAHRYADPQPDDRKSLDEAYAAAMRKVWKAYPEDPDIGALFAESMMDLRPWDLWTPEGQPQPGTEEIVATLEAVLTQSPNHPLGLHLYVHAVEASPQPQKGIAPANRLRDLQPGLGHMVHMPSHIDVRVGHWLEAVTANTKAIDADRKYRMRSPHQDFYQVYMAHNYHMLSFAAMMRGQSKLAISSINDMAAAMPEDWVKENAVMADGFAAAPLEVLVRFGRWDEVLAAKEPPDYLPIARTLRHGARGIAYAAKGEVANAKMEQQSFLDSKRFVADQAVIGNNKAADVLAVAEHLLAGEILVRDGELEPGVAKLREAIQREDKLRYSEPPDWIHPVRHALGAILLASGNAAEAQQVYEEDLARLPNNGWSFYGMSRCLELQNNVQEAQRFRLLFDLVWRDADIKITSSCFCQP